MKKRILIFFNYIRSIVVHFGLLSLLIIPILGFVNWSYFSVVSSEKQILEAQQMALANEKINIIDFVFEQMITTTHNDLHVIKGANEMQDYLNDPTVNNRIELEQLLYRIASNKPEFLSIALIDSNGEELARVERNQSYLTIVSLTRLENRSLEDYFSIGKTLDEDELYISSLSLLENDGVLITPHIPEAKFVLAIHDNYSNSLGVLVIRYNANNFLNVFSQYDQGGLSAIELGLINENVFWTISKFNTTYYLNHQNLTQEMIDEFENNDKSIILKDINIQESITHNVYNDEGFFKITASINFEKVFSENGSVLIRYPIIIYMLNLFIIAGFIYLGGIVKKNNDGRILLNARMYLSEKSNDGVIITNEKKEITYVNKAFQEIYGYNFEEVKGKTPMEIIGGTGINLTELEKKGNNIVADNNWHTTKSGVNILKYVRIRKETTSSGKTKHFLAIYSQPQIELEDYFSLHDNSHPTLRLISSLFSEHKVLESRTFIMVIKLYNNKGNFSKFLRNNLNNVYQIAVPKDDYTIIYNQATKKTINQQIALIDNLFETYKHSFKINKNIKYRLGVAVANINTKDNRELLDNAFIAFEISENLKNNKYLIYSDDVRALVKKEKDIFSELESAFKLDEFFVNYQIQKNIETNKFTGVEALLRWENKKLGSIPPNSFIPIIENSLYINLLSLMVIKKVINDFEPYANILDDDFRISINLTSFDFNNDTMIKDIIKTIESSKISPKHFCFEITESGYLENTIKTNTNIDLFHEKDIIIAIDDFGTGFSSINSLKAIKVDKVKIDRDFIKDYPETDDGSMFAIIANLIKNLNLPIVVEGTETKEQVEFSKLNQCQEIQGYYISKPISITEFANKYIIKKNPDSN
jgi:PAS domain S-box-containing protein